MACLVPVTTSACSMPSRPCPLSELLVVQAVPDKLTAKIVEAEKVGGWVVGWAGGLLSDACWFGSWLTLAVIEPIDLTRSCRRSLTGRACRRRRAGLRKPRAEVEAAATAAVRRQQGGRCGRAPTRICNMTC